MQHHTVVATEALFDFCFSRSASQDYLQGAKTFIYFSFHFHIHHNNLDFLGRFSWTGLQTKCSHSLSHVTTYNLFFFFACTGELYVLCFSLLLFFLRCGFV